MAVMPIILPRRAALPPLLAVCLLLAAAAVAPASAAGPRKLLQTAVPGNFQALVADAVSSATHSASGALALADAAAAAAAGGGAPSVAGTAASSTTSGGSYAQQYAQDPAVVSNVQEMINHALNRDAAVSAESSTAAGALRAAPAGSAAASSASGDILSLHNSYRARHSAPPMSWSSSLQASAQQWSNHLAAACSFYHSSSSGVGENLAYGQRDWTQVAAAWYDEVHQYNFNNPGFSHGTGHFTQMVWVSSTQLGCAAATGCGTTYYTCHYSPAGNIASAQHFRDNVLPATGGY